MITGSVKGNYKLKGADGAVTTYKYADLLTFVT